jgi:carboxymethylenebutenolidase
METESERVTVDVDGASMPAFLCYPNDEERHPAVIVVHELFGLEAHHEDVACRFAAEGYVGLAPDLFWNVGPLPDFTDREVIMRFRRSLDDRQLLTSLDAAVAYLREQPGVDVAHVGIVGFCMGGYYALAEALNNSSLAACVDFYGGGMDRLFDRMAELRVPFLGLFGDEDQSIPPERVRELRGLLQQAGVPFEIHTYHGAGHAFFNDMRSSYRQHAAEDAWARTLQFYQKYLR